MRRHPRGLGHFHICRAVHVYYVVVLLGILVGPARPVQATSPAAYVQSTASAAWTSSSSSLAFPANTLAGDFLLVAFDYSSDVAPSSITDSQGNVFTPVEAPVDTLFYGLFIQVYYAQNIKGGADTVTVSFSGTSSIIELYLTEYSGIDRTNPIDAQVGVTGEAGEASSGNVTTTVDGDMIYAFCLGASACTVGSGFTARSTLDQNLVEDMVAGAAGSYVATATASDSWAMQMVALKPAAISPPVITSATSASGTLGTGFCYQITTTNTPSSYGASDLPAGLSLNSSTGLISGTPTSTGIFPITLSATNAVGTGSATLTLIIARSVAAAYVQGAATSAQTVNNVSLALPANTVPGNLLMVAFDYSNGVTVSSVTDSQGNVFTPIGSQLSSPEGWLIRVYYAANIKGGADTITVALEGTSSNTELYLNEYSGIDPTNPIDAQAGASGDGETVSSGSTTTTVDGDMIYAFCLGDAACSAGSGFTARSSLDMNLVEDMLASTAGSYAATGTANSGWAIQMVALKPASASAPSITSVTPTNGPVGAMVTISGAHFGATQGSSTIAFNGTPAVPASWSDSSITVPVPAGATSGNIVVMVNGFASNGVSFNVWSGGVVTSGNLNTARVLPTATLLDNGKVLFAGGEQVTAGWGWVLQTISSAELYDPTTGTFGYTGSMNSGRIYPTASLLNNGKVLIAGGTNNNWNNIAQAELYDPISGTFSYTGSLGTPRSAHTATVLKDGTVLIMGGVVSFGDLPDDPATQATTAEIYDPRSGTFAPTNGLPAPTSAHTATLLNNGQVLVVGGTDSYGNPLATAQLYDPATGTFTPTDSLHISRASHSATLLNNGKVLIAGGWGPDIDGVGVASSELYDPATGIFTLTGSLNIPRMDSFQATLLNNGMVLISGGYDNNDNVVATVELYDPASGTFLLGGNLNTARAVHTATLLNIGQVLIAGGVDNPVNNLVSAELYQPSTLTPSGLVSIAVNPTHPSIPVGTSQQFFATGTFSDNSTETLHSVTWNSSAALVATINNDTDNSGAAWGLAQGTATITACAGSTCGSTTLSVTPAAGYSQCIAEFRHGWKHDNDHRDEFRIQPGYQHGHLQRRGHRAFQLE